VAISGLGVAYAAGGFVLLYSGWANLGIKDTLTGFLKGTAPAPSPSGAPTIGVSDSGSTSTATPATGTQAGSGTACTIPALGCSLPPQSQMNQLFGSQGSTSNETEVQFCGKSVQINKVLATNLTTLGQLFQGAGLCSQVRDIGGFRTAVGASGSPIPFSMHNYGAAFDINEDGGPNGDWNTMTLPAQMYSLASSMGWCNGSQWSGASRDGGHFQFQGGLSC